MGAQSSKDRPTGVIGPPTKMRLGSFKRGGSKKREAAGRPTSPLSDGSTNSSTIPRTPQQLPQTRPPPPQKNGTSNPPPTVVELKTPPVRKVPSRRTPPVTNNNNSHSKPAPLKDHNRQQQQQPTAIVKSVPETRHNSKKTAVSTEVEARNIASRQLALALPHLKHGSLGFEALAVLLQYLMFDLDAFSTPKLKNDLEKIKNEWLHTKLELEEGKASYRRLEDTHKEEVKSHEQDKEQLRISLQDLEQLKESHQREIIQLRETYEAEVADLKLQLQQELRECKEKYERILSDSEQRHKDKEDSLTQEWNVRMKELRDDHHNKLEKMQDECTKKNEELQKRLSAVQEEYRVEWRKAVEKMQKDRDSKIQVTAGRCKELEDEVQSLQTVVDLRSRELQESRKQISILSRFAEELPAVQQRAQTLQARVEDLQAQLKNKVSTERQLSEENKLLLESYHQESKQKKRISLHNEELQYKLKQREEYMLAALSGGNLSTQSLTESFRSPIHHSTAVDHNAGVYSRYFQDDTSPPSSPKIKSFVEKSDSIAYVLEIDEDPEEVMSRLVRKAGSFRGISNVTPKNNCSPARARTLPPPKRPRNKGTSLCLSSSATTISPQTFTKSSRFNNTRCRSRSVSADAAEDGDYMNWVPQNSTSRKVNNKIENYYKVEANQNNLKNGNAYHEDNECDFDFSESRSRDSLLIDDSLSRMLPSDSSNEADSPSKCSSSGGSSHEGRRHKKNSRHKRKGVDSSLNLVSSTSDLAEPQVLPLPPLPGTGGDRKFLTANLTRMPKESGGEAMISEEISDDENNVRQVNSSSDEQSNSDGEEQSSSSESSLEPEPIKGNSGVKQSLSNHQNISTSKLQRLLLSDSGSPSAATTAMDMSWSEDMDLMPSE